MKPITLLKQRPLIYCIHNTVNGKVYIGKTKCIWKRCHQYLSDVRTGNKSNQINDYLYNSMIKYGIDAFEMFPIEFVDEQNIAEKELWWMQALDSLNQHKGYNLRSDSSSGMHTHVDTKQKISTRVKKEWEQGLRDGHAEKLKESWKTRDRSAQSKTFSTTLTKYAYIVTTDDGSSSTYCYRELKDMKLSNVIAKFHKKNSNLEKYKGVVIERVLVNES